MAPASLEERGGEHRSSDGGHPVSEKTKVTFERLRLRQSIQQGPQGRWVMLYEELWARKGRRGGFGGSTEAGRACAEVEEASDRARRERGQW